MPFIIKKLKLNKGRLWNIEEWCRVREADGKDFFDQFIDILAIFTGRVTFDRKRRPPLDAILVLPEYPPPIAPKQFPAPLTIPAQASGPNFRASLVPAVHPIKFDSTVVVRVNQFVGDGVFGLQAVVEPVLAEGHPDFGIECAGCLDFWGTGNASNARVFAV